MLRWGNAVALAVSGIFGISCLVSRQCTGRGRKVRKRDSVTVEGGSPQRGGAGGRSSLTHCQHCIS